MVTYVDAPMAAIAVASGRVTGFVRAKISGILTRSSFGVSFLFDFFRNARLREGNLRVVNFWLENFRFLEILSLRLNRS